MKLFVPQLGSRCGRTSDVAFRQGICVTGRITERFLELELVDGSCEVPVFTISGKTYTHIHMGDV